MDSFANTAWALFWRAELPYLLIVGALAGLTLGRAEPADRAALRHSLVALALCLLLELVTSLVVALGLVRAGTLAHGAALVATGFAVIRLVGLTLFRVLLRRRGLAPPRIVEDVVLIAAYAAWGLLQLRLAGVDLASLVTTSAIITAVLAFAMQDTLGNVLGGLFLELDDSLAIGDWVKLDELSGRVIDIRWRHTAIRTRNGETVVVPNSALMKSRYAVIGNPDSQALRWRRWIWFEVGYETPAAQVIAAAEQALAGAELAEVCVEPAPQCLLMELGPGLRRYALRYWLADPERDDLTDSRVRVHLLAALERAGIALALPTTVIHRIAEDEPREARLRAEQLAARVRALQGVELFAQLTAPELETLAGHLVRTPFAAGSVITRQGAVAHWLYLLIAGEAEVWHEAGGGARQRVALLTPGTVFGEMGLMTGEPRSATVTARSEVECYRLDKAGFESILRARPALAQAISQVLAARASGLSQAVANAEARAASPAPHPESLLRRIRGFFHLDEPSASGPT